MRLTIIDKTPSNPKVVLDRHIRSAKGYDRFRHLRCAWLYVAKT